MSRIDDAYVSLKRRILCNEFPTGNPVLEAELRSLLRMSRIPIHKALTQLQHEGLVEIIPSRGVRVLPISPDDMRETYELFSILEPEVAAALADTKPTAERLAALETATSNMEQAIARKDLDAWSNADNQFHRCLVDLHGNRQLRELLNTPFDQAHRARLVTLHMREPPERSTKEHRAIIEHIASGNAEAAYASFRAHRVRVASELLAILHRVRVGSDLVAILEELKVAERS